MFSQGAEIVIRALVVDSNKLIQWSLKESLNQEGYETDTMATAKQALNRIMEIPYRLIVFGLEMIDEDSFRLLNRIQNIAPSTNIVILTSRDKNLIEFLLSDLNITSIIEKPFRIDTIKAIAREASGLI